MNQAVESLIEPWDERIAIFCFLATLDEYTTSKVAVRCSEELRRQIEKHIKKSPEKVRITQEDLSILFVQITSRSVSSRRRSKPEEGPSRSVNLQWSLPKGLELGPWRQFQKDCDWADVTAVIWNQVLGISPELISAGIGVTPGTIRYRVGHGLRALAPLTAIGNLYA